jgi:enterochelin esterase-like enzyme
VKPDQSQTLGEHLEQRSASRLSATRRAFGALALGAGWSALATPLQRPQQGRIERLEQFPSKRVDARHVEVWLPPGYDGKRPHAVLYMHDGQMLFDAATTWNKQAWAVDVTAARLIAEAKARDFIVVGPWNNGKLRFAEYFPQAWLPLLGESWRQRLAERALFGPPRSDAYLRFLVEELKPHIDARYATRPGRDHCFLMGSSMGGLISCYGLCEYPKVFGGAACVSTHWIGGFERNEDVPAAALAYLRDKLPPPDQVRLWMDRGTVELDALYDQAQARIDALMAAQGFRPPRFVSKVYPGSGHNETDWSRQLHEPLQFLFGA